ncbi:hypothetical protein D3C81_271140 [compost metagenome]
MAHRQGRAAAGVAVRLGEDDAGERQRFVERLGGIGSILTCHGIHHEQGLDRLDGGVEILDLRHHLGVHVQTTGGIDDHHVIEFLARLIDGGGGDRHWFLGHIAREEIDRDVIGQGLELLDRRRAVDVGTDHQHLLLVALLEQFGELAHSRGLTGTLQARHQDDGRRLCGQIELLVRLSHNRDQLAMDYLDEGLARAQGLGHFLADGTLFHAGNEVTHHRQGHVSLEQRHAHFTQGILDVLFGQPATATDIAQGARESFSQILKHDAFRFLA